MPAAPGLRAKIAKILLLDQPSTAHIIKQPHELRTEASHRKIAFCDQNPVFLPKLEHPKKAPVQMFHVKHSPCGAAK
jgi:hypothetical protein